MIRKNDVLGYSNMKIFQDTDLFSFSLDSVILANYTNIRLRDNNIVDFCTGNAIVPLILSRRCSKKIIGIEVQNRVCDLANMTIDYNNLNDRISIINCNVIDFCSKDCNHNKYDLVLCNPPYFKDFKGSKKNDSYEKMIARHEILINLEEVIVCAKKILKDNGSFSLVHRSERLAEIIMLLKENNIEPKSIKFVHEYVDSPSTLVLVQGQKNGKVGMIIDQPLIMFDKEGNYTDEYESLMKEVRK